VFSSVWWTMCFPTAVGLVFSFVLEQLFEPKPKYLWKRRISTVFIHIGLWLIIYLIEFLQFRRPWLATLLTSTIFFVLVLINHAKFRLLKEPFIYQDFEYFKDAIKHPRLYLPFFGIWKIFLCLGVAALTLFLGVIVEIPTSQKFSTEQVFSTYTFILTTALALLCLGHLSSAALSYAPLSDLRRQGLMAMLWRYAWAEVKYKKIDNLWGLSTLHSEKSETLHKNTCNKRPNIVVIQSESFFDPRRTFSIVDPVLLAEFDHACRTSAQFGELIVPAWGANTVRTEFAFLTGIDPQTLGINQFNPYRKLIDDKTPSIARIYRKRGYKTICIHPYPASFYMRDRIFPLLGFDEFIDIKSFDKNSINTACPYISDQSLADKVIECLTKKHDQPLFIFVITMENHGPLHLETITRDESKKWIKGNSASDNKDFAIYLRHLANADQMIKSLIHHLSGAEYPSQLLWYGDHVPVLPDAYQNLGMPDGLTNYFLWRGRGKHADNHTEHQASKTIPVHQRSSQPFMPMSITMCAHQLAVKLL
jgi:phosphoglycerol transferase MdoB-like AlkP superfamily enzyme